MTIQIRDITPDDLIEAAEVLRLAFETHYGEWLKTDENAQDETREAMEEGKIVRVATDTTGKIVGWVGAMETDYGVMTWELHPLAVHPDYHGQGIGRQLVTDLEAQVKARGCKTMILGSDDEDNQTSLYGVDVWDDLLGHIQRIQNTGDHPFGFYQKLGYVITGIIPDANGFGKPDILMAKRL